MQTYFCEGFRDCFHKSVDVVIFHRSQKSSLPSVFVSTAEATAGRIPAHWQNTPRRFQHELNTSLPPDRLKQRSAMAAGDRRAICVLQNGGVLLC